MKKVLIFKSLFLSLILMFIFTLPTLANTTPSITRLSGNTRYETSSVIAEQEYTQSDYAILCYGENFPDALSATLLAKKYDAPILLTTSSSLPDITKKTLIDLKVKNVIIIGGPAVISSNVESELQSMGISSSRIFGKDRYETSVKIAQQVTTSPTSIFVVTGNDFADGLSVSPIAMNEQIPIILMPNNFMPDSVKNYISSDKSIAKSYVIGDSNIISDDLTYQFPNPERIIGSDKYDRNIAINMKFSSDFNSGNLCLATGESFPDALSGSVFASKMSAPIILVNSNPSNNTKFYYQQLLKNASDVYLLGGVGVIPDNTIQLLGGSIPIVDNGNNLSGGSGILKGTITWQYNKLIGTKGDVNAKVALIPKNFVDNGNPLFALTIIQSPQGQDGIYTTQADGYGNYIINDVPSGSYYLLIYSANTNNNMIINSNDAQILSGMFSDKDWTYLQTTLKLKKYVMKEIDIKDGKTYTESYDFGNTYI